MSATGAAPHVGQDTVDIVIVSFNTRDLLAACLASIAEYPSAAKVNTYVVDNASADGSPDLVTERFPWAHMIRLNENLGFGAANNRGIAAGTGEFVLFLNSDAEVTDGAVDALVQCVRRDQACVMAGPQLFFPDGSFQPSCRRFPGLLRNLWGMSGMQARFPRTLPALGNWLAEQDHFVGEPVQMISGACFMARRSYLDRIGGFDEDLFLYEEELDVMYPAWRAGERILYCPGARVLHHRGGSTCAATMSSFSARHMYRSKYYAFRKHYGGLYARVAYLTDAGILGLSFLQRRLRRSSSPAAMHLAMCRRGWRDSFVSAAELRHRPDFLDH